MIKNGILKNVQVTHKRSGKRKKKEGTVNTNRITDFIKLNIPNYIKCKETKNTN